MSIAPHGATYHNFRAATGFCYDSRALISVLCFFLLSKLDCCAADLLEELETLVQQLDQQEAAKQQALSRAAAAQKELEAVKAQMAELDLVSMQNSIA